MIRQCEQQQEEEAQFTTDDHHLQEDFHPIQLGVHVGDIAYNLDLPPNGDNYMSDISTGMAATIPWMFAPGNHEADCNYTYNHYKGMFAAQNLTSSSSTTASENSNSSRWYSFELGPVHFSAIDTDAYGFDEVAYILAEQFQWLEQDLAAVDRNATPFVVLLGHRPMYCSSITAQLSSHLGWPKQTDEDLLLGTPMPVDYGNGFRAAGVHPPQWAPRGDAAHLVEHENDTPTCGIDDLLRNGMLSTTTQERLYGLEPLMAKYEVNVYLTGHEHNYERLWPTMNGTSSQSYTQPGKPVHVVTGSGGAYGKDEFGIAGPWDAFRSSEWSYSDIVVNRTHFTLRQRLATNSTVIDSFVLTR
jgi:hypothetical protein